MIDSCKLTIGIAVGAGSMLALAAVLWGRRVRVHCRGGVLVTGASSGIGRHAAESLAAEGYTVFAGVRKEADAESLKKVCPAAIPVMLDVCSQDSIDKCMEMIQGHLSKLNLSLVALVNNAGIETFVPVEYADIDSVKTVYDVNVFGVIRMCKACIPMLRQAGPGARIVNVSSISGLLSVPGHSTYAGTKHALQAISTSLRLEVEQFGMWVCTINPGYIKTDILHKEQEAAPSKAAMAAYGVMYRQREAMLAAILKGSGPDVTSKAILHAIRSPRPWTRYLLACIDDGVPVWALAWMVWYMPTQWYEALLLSAIQAQFGKQAVAIDG